MILNSSVEADNPVQQVVAIGLFGASFNTKKELWRRTENRLESRVNTGSPLFQKTSTEEYRMITAIRHVGLVVSDLEKALEFWCGTMGFVVSRRVEEAGPHIDAMMGLKDVRVTTVKLAAPDGNLLELLHFHSHPDRVKWEGSPYSTGFTHVALTVRDVDETYRRLQKVGVTFPAEPQISSNGLAIVVYARCPDGVLLELVEIVNK